MTLSEFELGKLITLKQQGYSGWVVQQRLKEIQVEISINQINLLFRKWVKQGGRKIDRRGRKKLFNEELIEKIKQRIRANRTTTAVDIQKSKALNPNGASVRCVQYLLKEIGFNCRKSPSRPMLSNKNVDQRYKFALDMTEWNQNEISKILFSDECKIFCQKRGNNFIRVNRRYKVQKELFTPTQKNHGGKEIMVWAIISNNGPLRIVQIEGIMNSEQYLQIIQDFYKNNSQYKRNFIFQQDNCRVHTSKIIKSYFKEQQIEQLSWPSQSPDLNIIEHIWSFLKNYLFEKQEKIRNKEDLWEYSKKGFYSSECSQLITKLYSTFMDRIQELISSNGNNTHY